jgi:hypothetical protein
VSPARTTVVGHVWAGVTAPVGEVARAVCTRCKGARRVRGVGLGVEFSRDGVTWGDRFPCVAQKGAES